MFSRTPPLALPPSWTTPQDARQCRHQDIMVSDTANFSSTKKVICSFHFRDKKPIDENNAPERLLQMFNVSQRNAMQTPSKISDNNERFSSSVTTRRVTSCWWCNVTVGIWTRTSSSVPSTACRTCDRRTPPSTTWSSSSSCPVWLGLASLDSWFVHCRLEFFW